MSVFVEQDYKAAIRSRIGQLKQSRKGLSLKKVSARLRIQYTYLSKVMNDDSAHLSEDRLFRLCRILEWGPSETQYVMLMRSHAVAGEPEWREDLYKRLERIRKERKLNADVQTFDSNRLLHEMNYLFDPLSKVILISLFVPNYRRNPRLLCPLIGITPVRLKQVLRNLADVGLIELESDGLSVRKIFKSHIHYGRDHPLTRVHQSLLKSVIHSQLMRTPEEHKHSVLATFNLDAAGFEKLKEEFQEFLKRAEEIGSKSKQEGVYQLSIDLFKWF